MSIPAIEEFEIRVGAVKDYGFDYTTYGWLASGETISSSTWAIWPAITLSGAQNSAGITSVFVSGQQVGITYKLINTITTSVGRTEVMVLELTGRP